MEIRDKKDREALRLFIETRTRSIREAETTNNVNVVISCLTELAELVPFGSHERNNESDAALRGNNLPSNISAIPNLHTFFIHSFYTTVANFVLHDVVPNWRACFSNETQRNCVDVFFRHTRHGLPSFTVLNILHGVVASRSPQPDLRSSSADTRMVIVLKYAVEQLTHWIQSDALDALLDETTNVSRKDAMTVSLSTKHLISLPSLIHNRLSAKQVPTCFYEHEFYSRWMGAVFRAVDRHYKSSRVRSSDVTPPLADMISRCLYHGQRREVTSAWMDTLLTTPVSQLPMDEHMLLFQALSELHKGLVFEEFAVLMGSKYAGGRRSWAKLKKQTSAIFRADLISRSSSVISFLCTKWIPYRCSESNSVRRWVLDLMLQASVVERVLERTLAVWSRKDYVQTTSFDAQMCCTDLVRKMLSTCSKDAVQGSSILSLVCTGVQNHMENSILAIREQGMRVAETLSVVLDPSKPLRFEDLEIENEDDDENDEDDDENDDDDDDNENACKGQDIEIKEKTHPTLVLDPDAIPSDEELTGMTSDRESDSDSDSSSSTLQSYDLSDEEHDLASVRKPVYLQDCIEYLHSKEDDAKRVDKLEAALNALPEIIRRDPCDLKHVALSLTTSMLQLEDKFSLKDFESARMTVLSLLCTAEPISTTPFLISQALERRQLFQNRLDALNTMISAAYTLSNRRESPMGSSDLTAHEHVSSNLLLSMSKLELEASSHRKLDPENGVKTRTWGRRRGPVRKVKENRFSAVSNRFFFPLLYKYTTHSTTLKLLRGNYSAKQMQDFAFQLEVQFLSHVLHTLTCFMECSGASMDTLPIIDALYEFVWTVRDTPNAMVRRQVLYSLFLIFRNLPRHLLQEDAVYQTKWQATMDWIHSRRKLEPDEGCQRAISVFLRR